jgi:hypothetical protein
MNALFLLIIELRVYLALHVAANTMFNSLIESEVAEAHQSSCFRFQKLRPQVFNSKLLLVGNGSLRSSFCFVRMNPENECVERGFVDCDVNKLHVMCSKDVTFFHFTKSFLYLFLSDGQDDAFF